MRYLYLHGFASGPQSRKADAFRCALAEAGLELEVPTLDEGDFAHLTISRQLNLVERILQNEPARLAGSSMGGYLAALYAAAHPEIDRLALLAPAFSFAARWSDLASPQQIESWRATGWLTVHHYGENALRRVHYALLEDALKYPVFPDFHQAARIFHGRNDTVVPIALSREFVATHPGAQLTEYDSGHELLNVLPEMVSAAASFLRGAR